MYEEILFKAGFSIREVNVYSLLCNQGELMAGDISQKTNIIRTNVYDILNTLIKKGIVAYVIKNGKKYFRATDPHKIIDYVEQQQKDLEDVKSNIRTILPHLKSSENSSIKPTIEVYEGKEGMKTILAMSVRDSLKTKKEILGISVQQQKCRKLGGIYHERWYDDRAKYKIKSRYLMSVEEKVIPVKYTQFKILPKEAKNPNEVFIFGNKVAHFLFIGEVFTAILIENEEITNRWRDYFDFLWKVVK